MAKFKKKKKALPDIPTAALPDIIFMLLFFFMVTTKMKETNLKVKNKLPQGASIQKLLRKNLVSYVYIGQPRPKYIVDLGDQPVIQTNDVIIKPENILTFVNEERSKLEPIDRGKMWVSLKVDQEAKMGIVTDVKQELRKANALKINYSATYKATVN